MTNNQKPYEQGYYPPKAGKFTKFMRRFIPWQIIRFIVINIKMTMLILKSH